MAGVCHVAQGHYISYVKKEIRLPSEEMTTVNDSGGRCRKQQQAGGSKQRKTNVVWLKYVYTYLHSLGYILNFTLLHSLYLNIINIWLYI